ncbi:hypothetical protein KGM_213024 [Danaus plexippus plexippus]|uniref:Uncharacterized protein n=1 Tax=Danaus plexippus plexippus TaxID=278856 RepID=A0A212EUQ0_DANPL|nr:hypothetical protein KGM_213024 [Danaus plexippus plexippus]
MITDMYAPLPAPNKSIGSLNHSTLFIECDPSARRSGDKFNNATNSNMTKNKG